MSALLCKWLNNELGLASTISSIERDFSDGYSLAEVLDKLGCLSAAPSREEREASEHPSDDLVTWKETMGREGGKEGRKDGGREGERKKKREDVLLNLIRARSL
jgi:hypothetical protein